MKPDKWANFKELFLLKPYLVQSLEPKQLFNGTTDDEPEFLLVFQYEHVVCYEIALSYPSAKT